MKATPLADNTIQIIVDLPEFEGMLMFVEELVSHLAEISDDPLKAKALSAARKTARNLIEGSILATTRPTAHPDCPSLLKELDVRRDRLPWIDRPLRYAGRSTAVAYDSAFENGYRGWPKLNPYNRSDCKEAWTAGYDAGEAAAQERLTRTGHSVAFVNAFHAGFQALPKRNPYHSRAQSSFEGQSEVANTWRAGYHAGAEAREQAVAA